MIGRHVWSQMLGGVSSFCTIHTLFNLGSDNEKVPPEVVCVDCDDQPGVDVHIRVKWILFEQLSNSQRHVTNRSHSSQVDERPDRQTQSSTL